MAHAHGQGVQAKAKAFLQLAQGGEGGFLGGAVISGFGDGHQPAQAQVGQRGYRLGQGRQVGGGAAGLAVFAADVHLQADVQWRQPGRALLREALGDFQAVHGMYPVEMLGDGFGLVRLNGADEVPDQGQVAECLLLCQRFL
ncbi:hypothetical protein D3C71_1678880 [compost metagenome]